MKKRLALSSPTNWIQDAKKILNDPGTTCPITIESTSELAVGSRMIALKMGKAYQFYTLDGYLEHLRMQPSILINNKFSLPSVLSSKDKDGHTESRAEAFRFFQKTERGWKVVPTEVKPMQNAIVFTLDQETSVIVNSQLNVGKMALQQDGTVTGEIKYQNSAILRGIKLESEKLLFKGSLELPKGNKVEGEFYVSPDGTLISKGPVTIKREDGRVWSGRGECTPSGDFNFTGMVICRVEDESWTGKWGKDKNGSWVLTGPVIHRFPSPRKEDRFKAEVLVY